jgi:hypothetical protein
MKTQRETPRKMITRARWATISASLPLRIPFRARTRVAFGGAIAMLLVGTTALIAATPANPGPFTACLSGKGILYNVVASAATQPTCLRSDTLITFSNAQGPTGPQGPQGDKGDTGATGATGDAGPQGIQGDKGDKGDTGATGDAGPQGIQGPEGPAGPTGTLQTVGVSDWVIINMFSTVGKQVDCPQGTIVTGGGARSGFSPQDEDGNLTDSYPTSNGWYARMYNPGPWPTIALDVFAICATITSE